jgi:hypothetical protein
VVRTAAVSGQCLGKHVPVATNTNAAIEEWCILCGFCQDIITRAAGAVSSVMGYLLDSNDMSTEAKESPLLRAVTKQCVVKTVQAREDLMCTDL